MKATSIQNIKNVKDICFSIENDPIERKSKLTIVASTDDDIFAFEFEGSDLLQSCKKSGLFTGWEKDQMIRELESKSKDISNDNALLLETNKKLREENDELKTKLRHMAKEGDYIMYNGSPYTSSDIERLLTGIRQLEELKTPTIENFANEEPSSRSDILDLAKKCVCGKREQDYGTPESNFKIIADLWNDYLGLVENGDGVPIFSIKNITPMDVSMMMALLKIARIRNGGGSGDSFVDLAGYAACGGEIWHSNKETNGDSSQETN